MVPYRYKVISQLLNQAFQGLQHHSRLYLRWQDLGRERAMVNFMCQFEWATGCTDSVSTLFLGVPLKVFPKEISI